MAITKRQLASLLVLLPNEEINEKKKQIQGSLTPLWKYWQAFVARQLDLGRSPKSIQSIRGGIRVILRYTNLCTIEQANDQCYITDILLEMKKSRNLTACTRNTYLKNLKSYMSWLEKRGLIKTNNLRKAEKSYEPNREQPYQTRQEIETVINYFYTRTYQNSLGRLRDLLFVWLSVYTGARSCELLKLKCDDIYKSKDGWKIRICGSKQKARIRYYNCPQHIQEIYNQYMAKRYEREIYCPALFVSTKGKRPWSREGVSTFYSRIKKETGIYFTGHRVRRYVATRLNDEGLPLNAISRYLGHNRISTTELYIARTCRLTNSAAKVLSKEFSL